MTVDGAEHGEGGGRGWPSEEGERWEWEGGEGAGRHVRKLGEKKEEGKVCWSTAIKGC